MTESVNPRRSYLVAAWTSSELCLNIYFLDESIVLLCDLESCGAWAVCSVAQSRMHDQTLGKKCAQAAHPASFFSIRPRCHLTFDRFRCGCCYETWQIADQSLNFSQASFDTHRSSIVTFDFDCWWFDVRCHWTSRWKPLRFSQVSFSLRKRGCRIWHHRKSRILFIKSRNRTSGVYDK